MYDKLKYTLFLVVVRTLLDNRTTTNKVFLFKDIKTTFNIRYIEGLHYTYTPTHY